MVVDYFVESFLTRDSTMFRKWYIGTDSSPSGFWCFLSLRVPVPVASNEGENTVPNAYKCGIPYHGEAILL